jgi:hypothetical protein
LVESLVITPVVCVQDVAPDSKPGLATLLPDGGGVVPPQVVPLTLMPENAFSTPVHCALVAPYRSFAALTAAVRALA